MVSSTVSSAIFGAPSGHALTPSEAVKALKKLLAGNASGTGEMGGSESKVGSFLAKLTTVL